MTLHWHLLQRESFACAPPGWQESHENLLGRFTAGSDRACNWPALTPKITTIKTQKHLLERVLMLSRRGCVLPCPTRGFGPHTPPGLQLPGSGIGDTGTPTARAQELSSAPAWGQASRSPSHGAAAGRTDGDGQEGDSNSGFCLYCLLQNIHCRCNSKLCFSEVLGY